MRTRVAELLLDAGKKDPKFQILTGDHGYALFDLFRKDCSDQFINAGIAEQAMIGYAAGLSKVGFRPVVYGLASFIPMRVLEFIKMDVCYESLPIIILGDGAGLVYSTLGASHQCGEDMAVLRTLPNIKIYSPADADEYELCFKTALKDKNNASYIRIGKSDRPAIHNDNHLEVKLVDGALLIHKGTSTVVIFATGSMVSAAREIAVKNNYTLYSVPFISDCGGNLINKAVESFDSVITIEEHLTFGGLSTTIQELLKDANQSKKMLHIGLKKIFTSYSSTYEVALGEHDLSTKQIENRITSWL